MRRRPTEDTVCHEADEVYQALSVDRVSWEGVVSALRDGLLVMCGIQLSP